MSKRVFVILITLILAFSWFQPNASAKLPTAPTSAQTVLVSASASGVMGNLDSYYRMSISAHGRYVAFATDSTNLIDGQTSISGAAYIKDLQTGQVRMVSVADDKTESTGGYTSISADGNLVALTADHLVSSDTNGLGEVYQHNMQTGLNQLVSVSSNGTLSNGRSNNFQTSMTPDGRYIAFESYATNLVPNDTNNVPDIFVHDMQTGKTWRVSVASDGTQQNNTFTDIEGVGISADGRYVAFESTSNNLVPNDTNNVEDIFIHDNTTGSTTRVSVASDGSQSNGTSLAPVISQDGRYIAFESDANNLVTGDTDGTTDIFLHDMKTGVTQRISNGVNGQQPDGPSYWSMMSGDGRYIGFLSDATNLVPGDTNGFDDAFVFDRLNGTMTRASLADDGSQTNNYTLFPNISADGTVVGFSTYATTMWPGKTDTRDQVYARILTQTQYTISGHIKDSNNNPVSGVTVSDAVGDITSTDATGAYTFTILFPGTYTVTPGLLGHTFTPVTVTVNVPPDVTNADFIANPIVYSYLPLMIR